MENDTSGTERASKLKAWRISPTAIAIGLVALLLAWQWYDGGNRIGALRDAALCNSASFVAVNILPKIIFARAV